MVHPKSALFLLFTSLSIMPIIADEDFENTANICSRCKCQTRATTFLLDCTSQNLRKDLANWPVPQNEAQNNITRIVAHLNKNNLKELVSLPATSSELIVFYTHNAIEKLGEGMLTNCMNITSLDLSYNKITSDVLLSSAFRGPYNEKVFGPVRLHTLNLAHNKLHTIKPNFFEHMKELRSLDLSGNNFRILDNQTALSFKNLPALEYLNLGSNRLNHVNNVYFKDLLKLRYLDLSSNNLDFIPDTIKDNGRTLRSLRIDSNPIVEIRESDLLGLDHLVEFYASNLYQLNEIQSNAFGPLKHLRRVDISQMPSTIILADHMFSESVRELNMSYSGLELLPGELLNWTQLEVLDLRGNQLYCTCELHNVSMRLHELVTRGQDAAFCFDYKRYKQYKIYALTDDICFEQDEYLGAYSSATATEKILRMVLLSTSALLIICLMVAAWLGYVRCYRNQRINSCLNYSVSYGPIPMRTTL